MKRWMVLSAAMCAWMPMLAGCGGDGGSKNIENVMIFLKESTNQISSMTKSINKAAELKKKLKDITDDKEKKDIGEKVDKEVNNVLNATVKLREQAKELVALSQKQYAPPATEEERRDLVNRFRNRLTDDMNNLEGARKELNKALVAARGSLDEESLSKIELKLREADGEFESISRQ